VICFSTLGAHSKTSQLKKQNRYEKKKVSERKVEFSISHFNKILMVVITNLMWVN
jgi:hypothetical protein